MSRPFEPFERTTVSERVRDDIYTRIISGEIAPGSQLAAERVLAQQFGVARTSIREAIQGLVAVGLIERRGNRSFVVEQIEGAELPAADSGKQAIRALLEARQVLELTLIELAAARATARERHDAYELVHQPMPADLDDYAVRDREFHASLAGACGNPVLLEVYGRVLESLANADLSSAAILGITETDHAAAIARLAAEHRAIAEAYLARDTPAMLEAVERHLGPVQGRMSRLGRRPTTTEGYEAYAAMKTAGS